MFGKRKAIRKLDYDRDRKMPAIRCSICNGEQVGGLRNKVTGEFEEIMLIRGDGDLEIFRQMVGEQEIPRIY